MTTWRRKVPAVLVLAAALLGPGRAIADVRSRHERLTSLRATVDQDLEALEAVAEAVASQLSVHPGSVTGARLTPVADLPGVRRAVPDGLRRSHQEATVRLLERHADPLATSWDRTCSATLVRIESATYLLTSHHCFEDELHVELQPYNEDQPDVRDLTRLTSTEFGVVGPMADEADLRPVTRITHVVAPVDHSTDWALASLANPARLIGVEPLDLDLDLPTPTPLAGQEVAMYSYPSSAGPGPVATTGTYVGRSVRAVMGGYDRPQDVVAVDPASAAEDPCYYGASGSSAVLADGTVLGPLATRSARGYGPDRAIDPLDHIGTGDLLRIEDALRVDLHGSSVLCGFTVLDRADLRALADRLLSIVGST